MLKPDWLLTDEFIEFSRKIEALHDSKKALKQKLKEFYEQVQKDIAEIEAEADALRVEFDAWTEARKEKDE